MNHNEWQEFSQRTKQAHLQGTQSHRTKANLAKELASPPHGGHTLLFVATLTDEKKHERITWGFVQAGLDVQTSAICIAVLWFGLDGMLLGF